MSSTDSLILVIYILHPRVSISSKIPAIHQAHLLFINSTFDILNTRFPIFSFKTIFLTLLKISSVLLLANSQLNLNIIIQSMILYVKSILIMVG